MHSLLDESFYMVYFQQPGVAEAELERDVRTTIRTLLSSASGDAPAARGAPQPVVHREEASWTPCSILRHCPPGLQ